MSGLVDTSVFCGYWPFRCLAQRTPEALEGHLQSKGVIQAWVAATEAILYPDPMQANEPLFEAISGDGFFVPVAILDVTLATWRRDAERCLRKWGCRALKLAPNYHGYELSDSGVSELLTVAREADIPVCVQMRMMDERAHHPLMKVPGVPAADVVRVAQGDPEVRVLACGAYRHDLPELSEASNVWVELSSVEGGQTLRSAVETMGAEKLVFGSHSPFYYFEAVLAKLDVAPSDVSAETVLAVREANARALLGEETAQRGG